MSNKMFYKMGFFQQYTEFKYNETEKLAAYIRLDNTK